MNHPSTPPTKQNKPAFAILVAVILILFAGVGLAALMGWLPSTSHGGRPEELVTPPTEQPKPAQVAAPTPATQSSQYTAGAGTVDGQPAAERKDAKSACADCGIVESINGQSMNRQGNGNKDSTSPGSAVTSKIEGDAKDSKRYDVVVRMHDGQLRTVQTNQAIWRAGDQVRIEGDKLLSR